MIKGIKEIFGAIIKWLSVLILVFLILKLVTIFMPSFSQNNITNLFSGENNNTNNQSDSSSKSKSIFHFPYPGEWSFGNNSLNSAGTEVKESRFKYEAIKQPTLEEWEAIQKNNNYVDYNLPQTPTLPPAVWSMNTSSETITNKVIIYSTSSSQ